MWEQLSINRPHLVYIILGGFTTLFMLCSSIIKERLYIGEATVATLCGIIFGPHAANLINPLKWGNPDQITLEFSRIVLVVQCFAVGVELPKAYMERHWRSVTFLLIPVMTFGWLITSLFIWAVMHPHMNWLESLTVAACVTATDPVLASSVVGKGKFAKRVPKHLRDLLSAESGCNDGMAFPFIYLGLYLLKYRPHANEVAFHWFCFTILYECIFGAFYGVCVGYIARRAVRYAHERDLIDRESFLVFYFVLALFCAGSGSLLGLDDLLVGFAAGVGFSNDGWFTEKTEESHVSNVIDLLINLTFFVYFGTIIPWAQFNNGNLGLDVWKLVVIAILVLFFRRIPIMLALKPVIPDIKTWREALFAGHFGPIGVGAIFVAILARAELETDSTTPLAALPPESTEEYNVIYLIWPITCFLVICSIVVHGSSIAVFTLGKHINTLTLTMSYTQANDQPSWMERLPRIQSRSKSMMSAQSMDEKTGPDSLPIGAPGTFLRRQKEEDNPSRAQSRASSRHRSRSSKSKNWDYGIGPGGPVSQSAIAPTRRRDSLDQPQSRSDSDTLAIRSDPPSDSKTTSGDSDDVSPDGEAGEIFEEGGHTVYEDEDGNVLAVEESNTGEPERARQRDEVREGRRLMHKEGADRNHGVAAGREEHRHKSSDDETEDKTKPPEEVKKAPERPGKNWRTGLNAVSAMTGLRRRDTSGQAEPKPEQSKQTTGPARAYQYGNTIIVEDEDGEVIKKYDIPGPERKQSTTADPEKSKQRLGQMSKMLGLGGKEQKEGVAGASEKPRAAADGDDDDARIRFTITAGGRRMSKAQFIDQIRGMDPKSRVEAVEESNAPEAVKREARKDYREQSLAGGESSDAPPTLERITSRKGSDSSGNGGAAIKRTSTHESNELNLVDSNDKEVPIHNVSTDLRNRRGQGEEGETAAERRRRQALEQPQADEDSDDDGTERVPPNRRSTGPAVPTSSHQRHISNSGETAAERRRREGALGIREEAGSDSEDDNQPREPPRNIRFADEQPSQGSQPRQSALRWGANVGR